MPSEQKPPQALQRSMIQRIQHIARKTGKNHERITNILVMERFVERINNAFSDSTIIKGGLALEFRLEMPRTTKDIDIRTKCNMDELTGKLKQMEEFRPSPEDHLHFIISPDAKHPTITGLGVKYEGYRFQVVAKMAGKVYTRFGLDVAFNDPIYETPSIVKGDTFFEKYGIPPVEARVYPSATHLAEKLHAYTCPQPEGRVNSRFKDIIDMILLAEILDGYVGTSLYEAFELTFSYRGTHPIPQTLPIPPDTWKKMYLSLKESEGLVWKDIDEVFQKASIFMNPILAKINDSWSYEQFQWKESK